MPDLEKVLCALEHCDLCSDMPNCSECDYLREPDCMEHLKRDIIALLKAQEAMAGDKSQEVTSGFTLYCPNCGFANTHWGTISLRENTVFYCGKCGMEVEW